MSKWIYYFFKAFILFLIAFNFFWTLKVQKGNSEKFLSLQFLVQPCRKEFSLGTEPKQIIPPSPTLFKILPIFQSNDYLLNQIFALAYTELDPGLNFKPAEILILQNCVCVWIRAFLWSLLLSRHLKSAVTGQELTLFKKSCFTSPLLPINMVFQCDSTGSPVFFVSLLC